MMSKKHFIKLADALKGCKPNDKLLNHMEQWQVTCQQVADVCASTNERFDRDKFLRACGAK